MLFQGKRYYRGCSARYVCERAVVGFHRALVEMRARMKKVKESKGRNPLRARTQRVLYTLADCRREDIYAVADARATPHHFAH